MTSHPFWTYSREVVSFRFPACERPRPPAGSGKADRERNLQQVLGALERGGKSDVLLLGLGSGALAADLAAALPARARLTVCDAYPERVQAILESDPDRVAWWTPGGNRQLLTDSSPWALLVLLAGFAGTPGDTLCLHNPELARQDRRRHALVQRNYMSMEFVPASAGSAGASGATLSAAAATTVSAAAILRPDEPDLEEFFNQFPAWLHEVVVVWDAEEVPGHGFVPAAPLQESARPLGGDFAAQRNAMLQACAGDWVIYLDGDERLPPKAWAGLPGFLVGDIKGFYFPRLTLYPDAGHCMAGLGAWPDLQLRLFRRGQRVCFERPVHERLCGIEGALGILCALPILHFSHLRTDRENWLEKLAMYDQAAASNVRHRLNVEYPRLDLGFFTSLIGAFPANASLTTERVSVE